MRQMSRQLRAKYAEFEFEKLEEKCTRNAGDKETKSDFYAIWEKSHFLKFYRENLWTTKPLTLKPMNSNPVNASDLS